MSVSYYETFRSFKIFFFHQNKLKSCPILGWGTVVRIFYRYMNTLVSLVLVDLALPAHGVRRRLRATT